MCYSNGTVSSSFKLAFIRVRLTVGHVKHTVLGFGTNGVSRRAFSRASSGCFGPNGSVEVSIKSLGGLRALFRKAVLSANVGLLGKAHSRVVIRYHSGTCRTARNQGGHVFRGGGSSSVVGRMLGRCNSIGISTAAFRFPRVMRCCYSS